MSTVFLNGLKDHQDSIWTRATLNQKNITMLRSLRFVMKKYGFNIEIKRHARASSLIRVSLVKYKDGAPVDVGVDLGITDSRMERGLFELEHKTMQSAGLKSLKGLNSILEMLRRNKLTLPPHHALLNEIIMNGDTVRIAYLGVDKDSGDDLFDGVLCSDKEIIARTKPQKRIGVVLDNLENALYMNECEKQRKAIGEIMLKLSAEDDDAV